MYRVRYNGFTLIELLAVMSIIGVLSSIVLTTVNTARMEARDANRKSTLAEIQKGLELYYSDHGYYPSGRVYSAWDTRPDMTPYWCFVGNRGCGDSLHPILDLVSAGYMKPPPEDPLNIQGGNWLDQSGIPDRSSGWSYLYCSNYDRPGGCPGDNQHYWLGTNLETSPSTPNLYGNYNLNSQ